MMNFGGQEKDIRPGCIGYTQFTQGSPRNRDVKDNSHLKDLPPEEPDRAVISAPICHGSSSSIRYRECLKNHAASIGGNVVDGCGEFMPSGEEGSLKAFICAACNCHRNFHRKEPNGGDAHSGSNWRSMVQLHHPLLPSPSLHHAHHHHHHHHQKYSIVPPMTVAYGGGTGGSGGTESSSEDLNNGFQSNVGEVGAPPPSSNTFSKKRFRTKFTQEQKEKMLEFAEKVGWRLQKQEEEEIQKLCAEVGVKREVFKVWMHNNKNSNMMKKQQHPQQLPM